MNCSRHPEKRTISACKDCGTGFCIDCVRETDQTTYCFDCYRRRLNEIALEVSAPAEKREETAKALIPKKRPAPRDKGAPDLSGGGEAPAQEIPRAKVSTAKDRLARKRERLREERAAKQVAEMPEGDFLTQGPDEDFSILEKEKGISRKRSRRTKAAPVTPQEAQAAETAVHKDVVAPPREDEAAPAKTTPVSMISEDNLLQDIVSTLLRPESEVAEQVLPLPEVITPEEALPPQEKEAPEQALPLKETAAAVEALAAKKAAAEALAARKVAAAEARQLKKAAAAEARRQKKARPPKDAVVVQATAADVSAGEAVEKPSGLTAEEVAARREERAERWTFLAQPRNVEYTSISRTWWGAAIFIFLMLLAGALLWAIPNAYLIPKDKEYGFHSLLIGIIIGIAFWWKAGKKHGTKLAVQAAVTTFFALFIGEFLHWFLIVVKNSAFRTIFFDLISFKFLWQNGAEIMKNTITAMFPMAFLWILLLPAATAFVVGFGMPPIPEIFFQIGRALKGQSPEEKEAGHGLES